jgi:hypothetical protein
MAYAPYMSHKSQCRDLLSSAYFVAPLNLGEVALDAAKFLRILSMVCRCQGRERGVEREGE